MGSYVNDTIIVEASGASSVNRPRESYSTGEGGSQDLRLSLTFSPRVEIMLPREEGEDGGGQEENRDDDDDDDYGDEDDDDDDEDDANGNRSNDSMQRRPLGLNIQLRFTSMEVFEALETVRRSRRAERERARRQVRNRRDAQNNQRLDESSTSGEADDESGNSERTSPSFSLRNRRERGNENNSRRGRNARSIASREINNFFVRNYSSGVDNLTGERTRTQAILLIPQDDNRPIMRRYVDPNHKIAQNIPRLTHYINEPNVGRGFIKELCFSSDGRLICSPFGNGVRLMMFDENCSEMSRCIDDGPTPKKLYDVFTNTCHTSCVVSTKFSPTHCLLVSGCLNGKIVWHQPYL